MVDECWLDGMAVADGSAPSLTKIGLNITKIKKLRVIRA